MRLSVGRVTFLLLLSALSRAQNPAVSPGPPTGLSAFEHFFRRVADVTGFAGQPLVSAVAAGGQTISLRPPDLGKILGLSEAEVRLLGEIASACVRDVAAAMPRQPWVLEARLERMKAGQLSPAVAARVEAMTVHHDLILRDAVSKVRAAIGEQRFAGLETFARDPASERFFLFTPVAPVVIPAAPKQ